jgi:hypothetical protein
LKKIDAPIGVVAVAGMYRTGKSYLLNRMLLNQSNGFDVGPTINPCTKVSIFASQLLLKSLTEAFKFELANV